MSWSEFDVIAQSVKEQHDNSHRWYGNISRPESTSRVLAEIDKEIDKCNAAMKSIREESVSLQKIGGLRQIRIPDTIPPEPLFMKQATAENNKGKTAYKSEVSKTDPLCSTTERQKKEIELEIKETSNTLQQELHRKERKRYEAVYS